MNLVGTSLPQNYYLYITFTPDKTADDEQRLREEVSGSGSDSDPKENSYIRQRSQSSKRYEIYEGWL